MTDHHRASESQNGVRFAWNLIPTCQPSGQSPIPIPVSASYSPFAQLNNLAVLPYKPVECNTCKSILNPYAQLDFQQHQWKCPFCLQTNQFPAIYQQIQENYLPSELQVENTSVEYVLPVPQAPISTLDGLSAQSSTQKQPDTIRYPTFVFVIDTAIEFDELKALKRTLIQQVSTLPPSTTIGLITFGKNVEIHELSCQHSTSRSYSIRGNITDIGTLSERITHAIQRANVNALISPLSDCEMHLLDILEGIEPDPWEHDEVLLRPERCTGVALYSALQLLTQYSRAIFAKNARDIGIFPRVCLLTGGISTRGIGASASIQRADHIRSHAALMKEKKAKELFTNSTNFFHTLAYKSIHGLDTNPPQQSKGLFDTASPTLPTIPQDNNGVLNTNNNHIPKISYDIFACCLDQMGLAELSPLVEHTNGMLVLDDSFTRGVFRGSLKQYFTTVPDALHAPSQSNPPADPQQGHSAQPEEQREMFQLGFNAIFETSCSRQLEVAFSTGNVSPLPPRTQGVKNLSNINNVKKMTPNVAASSPTIANTYIDLCSQIPFTNRYYINTLTPHTTISTIYVPIVSLDAVQAAYDKTYGQKVAFQFRTHYRDSLGRQIIRVTTVTRDYANVGITGASQQLTNQLMANLRLTFDQEAALTVLTKLGLQYVKNHYPLDVVRWYDAVLLEMGKRYGMFHHKQPNSFAFPPEIEMLPQHFFYLRRSQLFDIFNSSPDETAFFRLTTLSQNTNNTLLIIQPQLIQYNINEKPQYVPLDPAAMDSKRILFLDTFFHIVIWYGQHIASWKEQGLHTKQEYAYLNDLIRAPLVETKQRLSSRFPTPRYIECVEKGSQSRFLLAKLNPVAVASSSHLQQYYDQTGHAGGEQEKDVFSEAQSLQDYITQFKQLVTGVDPPSTVSKRK